MAGSDKKLARPALRDDPTTLRRDYRRLRPDGREQPPGEDWRWAMAQYGVALKTHIGRRVRDRLCRRVCNAGQYTLAITVSPCHAGVSTSLPSTKSDVSQRLPHTRLTANPTISPSSSATYDPSGSSFGRNSWKSGRRKVAIGPKP